MKKIIALLLVLALSLSLCACDSSDYKKAMKLFESGEYEQAKVIFVELADYQDAAHMAKRCDYESALRLIAKSKYEEALALLEALGEYEDAPELTKSCGYNYAMILMDSEDYEKALPLLRKLAAYRDGEEKLLECVRAIAEARYADGDLTGAVSLVVEYSQYEKSVNIFLDLLAYALDGYPTYVQEAYDLLNEYVKGTWMSAMQREVNRTAAGQTINVPAVDKTDARVVSSNEKLAEANAIIDMIKAAYTEENLAAFDGRVAEMMPVIYENADKITDFFAAPDTYTNCLLIYSSMGNSSLGASARNVIYAPANALKAIADQLNVMIDCYIQ